MSYKQNKRSLPKRFADSQWAWDHVLGPAYNRRILKAASRHYLLFIICAAQDPFLQVGDTGGFFRTFRIDNTSIIGYYYCLITSGQVSLSVLKRYVESQGKKS